MNIVLLKHGDKYSADDVNRQAERIIKVSKGTNNKIYCFTEDRTGVEIECIDIPEKPKLRRWWNKMHLFRDNFPLTGKCVLFDLDVEIKKDPFQYIKNIDFNYPTFMKDYWKEEKHIKIHAFNTLLNSSTLAWTAKKNTYIWDIFAKNIDYHTRKYKGIDRFFWHENIEWKTFDNGIHESIIV